MLPLAHIGHWAVWVLYAVPVVVVLASIAVTFARTRRERPANRHSR
jgi:cytochrome c-type biogenesis protein CcmH/NrfF